MHPESIDENTVELTMVMAFLTALVPLVGIKILLSKLTSIIELIELGS